MDLIALVNLRPGSMSIHCSDTTTAIFDFEFSLLCDLPFALCIQSDLFSARMCRVQYFDNTRRHPV